GGGGGGWGVGGGQGRVGALPAPGKILGGEGSLHAGEVEGERGAPLLVVRLLRRPAPGEELDGERECRPGEALVVRPGGRYVLDQFVGLMQGLITLQRPDVTVGLRPRHSLVYCLVPGASAVTHGAS